MVIKSRLKTGFCLGHALSSGMEIQEHDTLPEELLVLYIIQY